MRLLQGMWDQADCELDDTCKLNHKIYKKKADKAAQVKDNCIKNVKGNDELLSLEFDYLQN